MTDRVYVWDGKRIAKGWSVVCWAGKAVGGFRSRQATEGVAGFRLPRAGRQVAEEKESRRSGMIVQDKEREGAESERRAIAKS